jgi:hypothetical protein
MGSQQNVLNQLVSFILGASAAVVLLFFLTSAGRAARSTGISSWANGTVDFADAPVQEAGEAAVHAQEKVNSLARFHNFRLKKFCGFCLYISFLPFCSSTCDYLFAQQKQRVVTEPEQDELARLLAAVADEDRTVIMTSVNEAWAAQDSLLDLFLESFRAGERIAHFADHLLVVALDAGALERCRAVHPHCYLLPAAAGRNLSDAKVFMSKDYIDLVWSKVRLQQRILELGYNFLFTVRRVPITRDQQLDLE